MYINIRDKMAEYAEIIAEFRFKVLAEVRCKLRDL